MRTEMMTMMHALSSRLGMPFPFGVPSTATLGACLADGAPPPMRHSQVRRYHSKSGSSDAEDRVQDGERSFAGKDRPDRSGRRRRSSKHRDADRAPADSEAAALQA